MQQIQDYLQTQGLSLNPESIQLARFTAQTVMQQGQALIEPSILFHTKLPESIQTALHEIVLKQIYMALDSSFSHQPIQTAIVYAVDPNIQQLIRVAQQGNIIEQILELNDSNLLSYLAVRTAQSGWLNITDDTEYWLTQNELEGEHNRRSKAQMSIPICAENGQIFGVLHLEAQQAFNPEQQAHWIGLALALLEPIQKLGLFSSGVIKENSY